MPNEQTPNAEVAQLSPEMLKEILGHVMQEARKPLVDEAAEARKERDRVRLKEQREESERDKEVAEAACSHLREDGSSRIAWTTNLVRAEGRLKTEGFCQFCNKHFHEGVEGFNVMVKIPTGARYSF